MSQPKMPESFTIPEPLTQQLVRYLAGRPWGEVAQLMGELTQTLDAQVAQANKPAENPAPVPTKPESAAEAA